jgi:SAM-dependent methyltransferase
LRALPCGAYSRILVGVITFQFRSETEGRLVPRAAHRVIPPRILRWLRRSSLRVRANPAVGGVDFGDLAVTTPIDSTFGLGRGGKTIDRAYIEQFLSRYQRDIAGRVLEVADDGYTRLFGGANVRHSDVLSLVPAPGVSIVADLCRPPADLPWGAFDCVIFTQTLQFVDEPAAALSTLARLLRRDGVLLATFPGISQISRYDDQRWGDRWRFTALAARELLGDGFRDVEVQAFGSVLTAVGVLHGLVVDDLPNGALDVRDPDYEVVITARAVRQ